MRAYLSNSTPRRLFDRWEAGPSSRAECPPPHTRRRSVESGSRIQGLDVGLCVQGERLVTELGDDVLDETEREAPATSIRPRHDAPDQAARAAMSGVRMLVLDDAQITDHAVIVPHPHMQGRLVAVALVEFRLVDLLLEVENDRAQHGDVEELVSRNVTPCFLLDGRFRHGAEFNGVRQPARRASRRNHERADHRQVPGREDRRRVAG